MYQLRGITVTAAFAALLVTACGNEESNASASADAAAGQEAARTAAPDGVGEPAFTRTADDPRVEWGSCPEWMPASCELAVIQSRDPDGLNADALLRMQPGTSVPEHWHTSAERMVVLSGVMEFDYEGQQAVRLTPGTYLYGPAKLPHETHCLAEGGEECVFFIAFEEPVDAIEGAPAPEDVPEQQAFIRTTGSPEVEWGPCPEWMPAGCELAVIQSLDPEGHNADALFKLAPGTRVPTHWHTSAERMVLLSGEMRVNYRGQPPTRLAPYTYAYGPAALPHDTVCEDGEECILFIVFEEPVDAIPGRGDDQPRRR